MAQLRVNIIKKSFDIKESLTIFIVNSIADMWTPYSKTFVGGSIYLSNNFLCFGSNVRDLVNLVIPLKIIKVNYTNKSYIFVYQLLFKINYHF